MKIDKLPGALVEHNISPPMGKAITLTIGDSITIYVCTSAWAQHPATAAALRDVAARLTLEEAT